MKTKLAVVNDIHLFSKNSIMSAVDLRSSLEKLRLTGYLNVNLGDNYDFANCLKSDIGHLRQVELDQYGLFDFRAAGNHERYESAGYLTSNVFCLDSLLFSHGDIEFWGYEKAMEYRNKPRGASWFKRGVIVNGIEFFEKHFESKINDFFLDNVVRLMKKYNRKVYICGHKHPSDNIIFDHCGFKIVVLKRGVNLIHYDENSNELNIV